jgi:hypothetical protein
MEIFHGKQIYEWWIFHSHDSLTEAYISETCQESQLTFGFVVSQAFTHIEEVASTSTWGCLKIWNELLSHGPSPEIVSPLCNQRMTYI